MRFGSTSATTLTVLLAFIPPLALHHLIGTIGLGRAPVLFSLIDLCFSIAITCVGARLMNYPRPFGNAGLVPLTIGPLRSISHGLLSSLPVVAALAMRRGWADPFAYLDLPLLTMTFGLATSEELCFRGVILRALRIRTRLPRLGAYAICATLFMLAHCIRIPWPLRPAALQYLGVVAVGGFVLSYMAEASRWTLLCPIAFHFATDMHMIATDWERTLLPHAETTPFMFMGFLGAMLTSWALWRVSPAPHQRLEPDKR